MIRTHKLIILISATVLVAMTLFPPWVLQVPNRSMRIGYAFLLQAPDRYSQVDIITLAIQWVMVIATTLFLLYLFKDRVLSLPKKTETVQQGQLHISMAHPLLLWSFATGGYIGVNLLRYYGCLSVPAYIISVVFFGALMWGLVYCIGSMINCMDSIVRRKRILFWVIGCCVILLTHFFYNGFYGKTLNDPVEKVVNTNTVTDFSRKEEARPTPRDNGPGTKWEDRTIVNSDIPLNDYQKRYEERHHCRFVRFDDGTVGCYKFE